MLVRNMETRFSTLAPCGRGSTVALVLVGALWTLQGLGYVGGGAMSGTTWLDPCRLLYFTLA